MPLRDLLRKKDKVENSDAPRPEAVRDVAPVPEFTFMRSEQEILPVWGRQITELTICSTYSQEIISPPTFAEPKSPTSDGHNSRIKSSLFKGRQRSGSATSTSSRSSRTPDREHHDVTKRISQRLGLSRDASSENVPQDLPEIKLSDHESKEGAESQWEHRATILAIQNEKNRSRPGTPNTSVIDGSSMRGLSLGSAASPSTDVPAGVVSTQLVDDNIQEAIRLHEAGELQTSTQMFGRLADPNGANNALSQVLYGLALRHGWGCTPNPAEAVTYLSAAASNAASIEELALQAGMKKGGAAKGELVLAIFELANCFRYGWGVQVDKVAAKQYYETAANLGDTDAMNEVAWCYVEGFGCKKDKVSHNRSLFSWKSLHRSLE
ncbi:HCP-like protein [Coleophoma crateriformis]|uniref:HCP-like protein n=1 Tax=Coleophoma crateriformis TaxID=565419 RepID=A0A3D8QEA1_9HELO|nr:HCP-like protein [Coleophoma crateriformis]